MRVWSTFCKLIQKQTYSCLSRNYGLWYAFTGICIIIVSAFHFGEVVLQWNMMHYAGNFKFSRYYDNIHGRSFETRLCLPQPIDVVYTWVNGSDPILIELLNQYKTSLFSEKNTTFKEVTPTTFKILKWKNSSFCPYSNCFFANKLALSGLPKDIGLTDLSIYVDKRFTSAKSLEHFGSVAIVSFDYKENVTTLANLKLVYHKVHLNISEVFFTDIQQDDQKISAVMVKYFYNEENNNSITKSIESILPYSVKEVIIFEKLKVAIVYLKKHKYVQMLINERNVSSDSLQFFHVSLIWKPFFSFSDDRNADLTSNRFADNNELKYSLRSIDTYAPWVRKIFIVTNGQIPNWLNLDHPRVQLITHEEIFANKSHLPTFSSPAIESNIHRIPGLSKTFIYMNDDVFFGKEVWPDDFYTHSKGKKIFQAWAVPNCHEGCPSSWLGDKYCDKACNYTECEWDGGDCINMKNSNSLIHSININGNQVVNSYCSNGCANSWLGDRYCDGNCNTIECGFDAGDCGTRNFDKLFFHKFSLNQMSSIEDIIIKVPSGSLSMFLNLTEVFQDIVEGNYQTNSILRSAVLGKKSKLLSLTFFKNFSEENVTFQILGYKGANNTNKGVLAFTLIVDTKYEEVFINEVVTKTEPTSLSYPKKLYNNSLYPIIKKKENYFFEKINLENLTLSNSLKNRLRILEHEYLEGDITEFGLFKIKNQLYEEHLHETQPVGRKLLSFKENNQDFQVSKFFMDPFTTFFSFLPWEKKRTKDFSIIYRKLIQKNKYVIEKRRGRNLLDTFSSSLLYVSRIYNKAFGYLQRKVPAHMPHMVDKDIIVEMQKQFQPYFEDTSSHKMRHPEDMQFAFSYNYYLIGLKESQNISMLFDMIDTDHSGTFSDRELRTLAAMKFSTPITIDKVKELETMFKNCSLRLYNSHVVKNHKPISSHQTKEEDYYDKELPLVTKDLFLNCHEIWRSLISLNNSEPKYKFELLGEEDVIFKMLQNNVSFVLHQLDWIRKNRKKFICINDDLDHTDASTSTIRVLLKDFFEAFFPIPSQFELKPKFKNKFLYKKDLVKWLENERFHKKVKNIALVLMLFVIICAVYKKKLLSMIKNVKKSYKQKCLGV